jgi:hypothetical protein
MKWCGGRGEFAMRKLLTIEEAFYISGRGVIVTPGIPIDDYSGPQSQTVILQRPDGAETTANATFDMPLVNPPPPLPYFVCVLVGLTKEDVPNGTEIWIP